MRRILAVAAAAAAASSPTSWVYVDLAAPLSPQPLDPLATGFNLFEDFDPAVSSSPIYQAAAATVTGGRGLLRYHNEGMMTCDSATCSAGWLTLAGGGAPAWNASKIAAAMNGTFWATAPAGSNYAVMVTFSAWPPQWNNVSNSGKTMNGTFAAAWTQLVVDGTRLLQSLRVPIAYIELTNEWDVTYASEGMTDQLIAIVLNTTAALRGIVAPGVKIGGPAWNRPDIVDNVTPFIAATWQSLDFYSLHSYCTGSTGTPNASIWSCAADAYLEPQLRSIMASVSGGQATQELLHDEANISWAPPDVRMGSGVGAVFDVLSITSALAGGGTSLARWNLADGWYGALDGPPAWNMRPPAYLWALLSQSLAGTIMAAAVASPTADAVTAFATLATPSQLPPMHPLRGNLRAGDSAAMVLVVNRGSAATTTAVQMVRWPAGVPTPSPSTPVMVSVVSDAGLASSNSTIGALFTPSNSLVLPVDSVTAFVFAVPGAVSAATAAARE